VRVKVRYYASFRDITGKAEEWLEVPEAITVRGIKEHIGGLYEKISRKDQVLVAVNGSFTSLDRVIVEGDEVALFPPVSGG
jgi:molybdopterin synthase sulfur carrier subunit